MQPQTFTEPVQHKTVLTVTGSPFWVLKYSLGSALLSATGVYAAFPWWAPTEVKRSEVRGQWDFTDMNCEQLGLTPLVMVTVFLGGGGLCLGGPLTWHRTGH